MSRGIRNYWGAGPDADVIAAFARSLTLWDGARYRDQINEMLAWLSRQQGADGTWPATWYFGRVFGTCLALAAFCQAGTHVSSVQSGIAALRAMQRADGGWGDGQLSALDTAVALQALLDSGMTYQTEIIRRGLAAILDEQAWDGFFRPAPWIRMDVGRARGRRGRILSYMSRSVTTAFCLRTLLHVVAADAANQDDAIAV